MAFLKAVYKKLSQRWHPQAVTVGKPVEMAELCKQISLISTVSSADAKATIEALGLVLGTFMNTGRTVHVEGFRYVLLHLRLQRQGRGDGREGERQPNHRHVRPLRPRVHPSGNDRHPLPRQR